MPIYSKYEPEHNVIVHEGSGALTFEEVRSELDAWFGASGWKRHSLWKFQDASLAKLSAGEIRALAAHVKMLAADGAAGKKMAWAASADVDYGLCRMWEIVSTGANVATAVFRSCGEARQWIADE